MKLINGKELLIDYSVSDELRQHFNDPKNYTKEIKEQFDRNYYKGIILPEHKTFLDIGANVGLFALHVRPYAKRIVCVEPTPSHFGILKTLAGGFAELENSALAGHTGTVKFHWCGINTTMNSIQDRFDKSFEVPCLTLTDLLDEYYPDEIVDFCKIDIEGSEHTAITEEIIQSTAGKIKRVFIELHPPTLEEQEKFQKIFEAAGYKVKKYVHDSLICDYDIAG